MRTRRNGNRIHPENLKGIVRKRAGGLCECCGLKPSRNPGGKTRGTIHHRHMRRLGGIDAVENMILLCVNCHRQVHKDEPTAGGYGYVSWVHPWATPLWHPRGLAGEPGWVLLVPDGSMETLTEDEALRLLEFVGGLVTRKQNLNVACA